MGDRVTKSPGVGWTLPPGHEPCGETTNEGSTQGIGERVTSEAARDGQGAVLVEHSTEEGGEVRPKRPMEGAQRDELLYLQVEVLPAQFPIWRRSHLRQSSG